MQHFVKETNKDKFGGIYTALVTPMQEDGAIDFDSLDHLVQHQLAIGVRGFYVGGSTGEGFILTSEERMRVLEHVIQSNAGCAKVIAHIGGISTSESVRLAKHAEHIGADAISAVVPFYYKISMVEIRSHYETIMASTSLPMIIYHYPGATGVSLPLDFYEHMAEHPQCIGVKFTSMNLFELQQIKTACGEDFLVFNGHDEIFEGGALMGADGAIGSTFNIMATAFLQLFDYAQENHWTDMRPIQAAANEIIAILVRYDVLASEKFMLYLQGVISYPSIRQPLKKLSAEEKAELRAFFEGNPLLQKNKKV